MTDFNQTRGFFLREGREKSARASEVCCCFCTRRGWAGSQINYCWSSGFGEGTVCPMWEARMDGDLDADKGAVEIEICQSSQPLLATERSILAHLSPLSRMPLDQIRWLVEEGGRFQQSVTVHLFLRLSAEVLCGWPTTQWVWMNQTDEEGHHIPPGWLEGRNAVSFSFLASIIYCLLLFVLHGVSLSVPMWNKKTLLTWARDSDPELALFLLPPDRGWKRKTNTLLYSNITYSRIWFYMIL